MRNDRRSALLLVAKGCLVGLLRLSPLYHRVSPLLSFIADNQMVALQFAFVFRHCLSTTLGWLSWSSIVSLPIVPFGGGFSILIWLWGNFREILLFHDFVFFRWRLLLLVCQFKWAAFVEDMFAMASTVVKNLPWDNQFPDDAIGYYHEAMNTPCLKILIWKENTATQTTINLVIESVILPNHFPHHTKPSEVQSKFPIKDESLDFTVARNCLSAPFACSLYLQVIPSKSYAYVAYLVF